MKKKITAVILISLILLQFIPLSSFLSTSEINLTPNSANSLFIPPEDKELDFSKTPYIHFSISYTQDTVTMDISVQNNLTEPISLFNLWIHVNKSIEFEKIILSSTEIIESQNKLTLSTFDSIDEMIFHFKLFEGVNFDINKVYNIRLKWFDPDQILAQYDPDLALNDINDDIEAFFQYSTKIEDPQIFPIIERSFSQEITDDGKVFSLNFKITNLMDTNLDSFMFKYVKMRDFSFERFLSLDIVSPFSPPENFILNSLSDNLKIEYEVEFTSIVNLNPYEWFIIRIKWIGDVRLSTIKRDYISWNFGNNDQFNKNHPYYVIGSPYHPLLTPAEPIVLYDYDFDGLDNEFELQNNYDPITQNSWLVWNKLKGDYSLNKLQLLVNPNSQTFEIEAEISIFLAQFHLDERLFINVENLGLHDKISDLTLNNEPIITEIISTGQYQMAEIKDGLSFNIKFTLIHNNADTDSSFNISFNLNQFDIINDLSEIFVFDHDGDGQEDFLEDASNLNKPDADLDGAFDGIDLSPNFFISKISNEPTILNFPINNLDSNSEIRVDIQIKPTLNDYTESIPYSGNELIIYPGLKLFGQNEGGDYLPDNILSLDNGKTGVIQSYPITHNYNDETQSWMCSLDYKYTNQAKSSRQIKIKFQLIWILIEHDIVSDEKKLSHIYNNNDPYKIQGISITENEPTTISVGLINGNGRYIDAAKNAELFSYERHSLLSYDPNDLSNLDYKESKVYNLDDIEPTRKNLQKQFLTEKSLDFESTNFINLAAGYSFTYNIEFLFDIYGENPEKLYTEEEINNFYELPESSFIGISGIQILYGNSLEYINQHFFGVKNNLQEIKTTNLEFTKVKYSGSTCNEIYMLKGIRNEESIEIYIFAFYESNEDVLTNEKITYKEIWKSQIKVIMSSIFGDALYFFFGELLPNPWIQMSLWIVKFFLVARLIMVLLKVADTVSGFLKMLVSVGNFLVKYNVHKVLAVLAIAAGTFTFILGIFQFSLGLYQTGIASMIRGGLAIATGILLLVPEPVVTKIIAVVLVVFQFIDWLLGLFGIDIWGWFLSTFFGIEDANPDYQYIDNSLIYDEQKIQSQGGFEVGDSIGVNIQLKNIGNTQLTFGLKVKAGEGNYGTRNTKILSPSQTGIISASDAFEYASPTFSLTSIVDVSWYYNPPGRWVVNIIPPFVWWVDPPASSGGPYNGDPNTATFNLPIFPNSLKDFVNLIKSGFWLPVETPTADVSPIKDEITPGVSEELKYDITLSTSSFESTYVIYTPSDGLWNYRFLYQGKFYYESITIKIPAYSSRTIRLRITPTPTNVLKPGDNSIMIRVQQEDYSLARTNVILDYKVISIIDFDVIFDPFKPEGNELKYDEIIASYINITNTGNIIDSYDIEVGGLDGDLYFLYKPDIFVRSLTTYSAVIGFLIPYYEIIPPGLKEFTIKISSVTDLSVFKVFDCSIDITEYHKMYFTVEEADLSMSDSDTYIYNFQLTNLGNVDEEFAITYTDVDIALIYLENNIFSMTPGQTELFSIILYPLELGYQEFVIAAASEWISSSIEASINIIDDDIAYPYFENLFILDDHRNLNISFVAIDDFYGDDLGLSNISIYVDGRLVLNYAPLSDEIIFNFSLNNDWIWQEGFHDIKIEIIDADNDRPQDSLTTTIYRQFEVTLDEMYNYVVWLLEELNKYIYDNSLVALYGTVTQKLVKVQNHLLEAYQLIEDGELHTGLVRNKIAEAMLELAETKTELKNLKGQVGEPYTTEILSMMCIIRNKIIELMGLSMGTDFAYEITLCEVNLYDLGDFIEGSINKTDRESILNIIILAAEKLEDAIFDISLEKDTDSSLTSALHALDHAKTEIFSLLQKGKISADLTLIMVLRIIGIQARIEELKNIF